MRIIATVSAVQSVDRVLLAWAIAIRGAQARQGVLCVDLDAHARLSRVCCPTLRLVAERAPVDVWVRGAEPLSVHSVRVRIRFVDLPFWARRGEVRLLPASAGRASTLRRDDGVRLRGRLESDADAPDLVVLDVPPPPSPCAWAAVAAADLVVVPVVAGAHADDEIAVLHRRLRGRGGAPPPMYVVFVGTRGSPALAKAARARTERWIRQAGADVTLSVFDVEEESLGVGLEAGGSARGAHALAVLGLPGIGEAAGDDGRELRG